MLLTRGPRDWGPFFEKVAREAGKHVDFFDRLALWGRKYERRLNPRTGERRFQLSDLLELFRTNTILELTPFAGGREMATATPDPVRKLKVSLLDDGLAQIAPSNHLWYEVYVTAPSGDLARAKVQAFSAEGEHRGEIQMLIAQRMPELYFSEDPILRVLAENGNQ
jgi:hypothetical protein